VKLLTPTAHPAEITTVELRKLDNQSQVIDPWTRAFLLHRRL